MIAQQLRTVQAQANPAQAQKGVGFTVHRNVGQRLVTANVQGAHHQIARGPQGPGDGAVGGGLLVMARRMVAIQIQKLRTQQTHTLASQRHRLFGFSQ